jgi:hypothetical protein
MRFRQFGFLCGCLVLVAACGNSVDGGDATGPGGSGGATTTSGSAGSTTTSGTAGAAGSGGHAAENDCGWPDFNACPSTQFCSFPAGDCGGKEGPGYCVDLPTECSPGSILVCGCDGAIYDSECLANAAGVSTRSISPTDDIVVEGECASPAGYSPCGELYCDTATEYCQGHGTSLSCKALPVACVESPGCGCLDYPCDSREVVDACHVTDEGGLYVVCAPID